MDKASLIGLLVFAALIVLAAALVA